jgi:hypothetical protein
MNENLVLVPKEIDRKRHGNVLIVWNQCMIAHETLEMTWPKLVNAIKLVPIEARLLMLQRAVQYAVNRLDAENKQIQISGDLAVALTYSKGD